MNVRAVVRRSYNRLATEFGDDAGAPVYACEHSETLSVDLKQRLGFRGPLYCVVVCFCVVHARALLVVG